MVGETQTRASPFLPLAPPLSYRSSFPPRYTWARHCHRGPGRRDSAKPSCLKMLLWVLLPSLASSGVKQKRFLPTRSGTPARACTPSSRLLCVSRVLPLSLPETLPSARGTLSPLITGKQRVANCPNYSRARATPPPTPRRARPRGAAPGRTAPPGGAAGRWRPLSGSSAGTPLPRPSPGPGGRSSHPSGGACGAESEHFWVPLPSPPHSALPALRKRGPPAPQARERPAPALRAPLLEAARGPLRFKFS